MLTPKGTIICTREEAAAARPFELACNAAGPHETDGNLRPPGRGLSGPPHVRRAVA